MWMETFRGFYDPLVPVLYYKWIGERFSEFTLPYIMNSTRNFECTLAFEVWQKKLHMWNKQTR